MMTMMRVAGAVVLLLSAGATPALAVKNPPNPGGPPVTAPPPTAGNGPALSFAPLVYPSSFDFALQLYGFHFAAGTPVAIQVSGSASARVAARSDGAGTFSTIIHFHWVFCGPGASIATPPTIQAAGGGQEARVTLPAPPCPGLFLAPVGQAITIRSNGTGTTHAATLAVLGFGFHPGESVSIHQVGVTPVPGTVTARADSEGRVEAAVPAVVTLGCGAILIARLLAAGNEGTTVQGPIVRSGPLPLCPVAAPPDDSGGSTTAVPPTFAVHLSASTVHPRQQVALTVRAPAGATARVRAAFPGAKALHRKATVPATGSVRLVWHVPSGAHPGWARVTVHLAPAAITLSARVHVT